MFFVVMKKYHGNTLFFLLFLILTSTSNATEVCRPNKDLLAINKCLSAGEIIGPDNNHTVKPEVCTSFAEAVKKDTDFTYTCTFSSYRHYYDPDHYGGGEFCELSIIRDDNGHTRPDLVDCLLLSSNACHAVKYCQVYDL